MTAIAFVIVAFFEDPEESLADIDVSRQAVIEEMVSRCIPTSTWRDALQAGPPRHGRSISPAGYWACESARRSTRAARDGGHELPNKIYTTT